MLKLFKRRSAAATKALLAEVRRSIGAVAREGYCAVSWQPAVLAVATPIVLEGLPVYALNMSLQNVDRSDALASEMGAYLNAFAAKCKEVLAGG